MPRNRRTPEEPEMTAPTVALTEGQRALRAMRKRWFTWSLLPAFVLLAGFGYFTYVQQWNAYGVEKYKEEDLKNTIYALKYADKWLPAESWVSPFNLGTTQIAQGAHKTGIANLETAERHAPSIDPETTYHSLDVDELPPMCMIRINHATGYALISSSAKGQAELHWNAVNAAYDSAARAKTKAAYNKLIAEADAQLAEAVEQYTVIADSSGKSAELLEEYLCTEMSVAGKQRTEQQKAERKLESAKTLEPPAWKPPKQDDAASDSPEEDPEEPSETEPEDKPAQEEPDAQDPQESEEPTESEDTDDPEETPTTVPYSPNEEARQEQLEERNKAGKIQREEADAYESSTAPSKKQW